MEIEVDEDEEENDDDEASEKSSDKSNTSSEGGRPGLFLSPDKQEGPETGKLTERKLNEKLDLLAGNVSEEDSGSWDEEVNATNIKSEEEYYDEEDYGTEDLSPQKPILKAKTKVEAKPKKP